jgi:hypothetical protein
MRNAGCLLNSSECEMYLSQPTQCTTRVLKHLAFEQREIVPTGCCGFDSGSSAGKSVARENPLMVCSQTMAQRSSSAAAASRHPDGWRDGPQWVESASSSRVTPAIRERGFAAPGNVDCALVAGLQGAGGPLPSRTGIGRIP